VAWVVWCNPRLEYLCEATDHLGREKCYIDPDVGNSGCSTWIPSRGKRPLPVFRYYGPTSALIEKTFVMPDFELVQ